MITGELKNKIDSLWDIFAAGGIVNPLDVIEQVTYLMFIRDLDDSDNLRAKEAAMLGLPYKSIFADEVEIGDRKIDGQQLKWSVFHDFPAAKMYSVMQEWVFPFIKTLHSDKNSAYSKYMDDAIFKLPTPLMLSKVVDFFSYSNIWISAKNANHGPRIKVQKNKGDSFQLENSFSMTIADTPKIIGDKGKELSPKDMSYFVNFILRNKKDLIEYWNGQLATEEILAKLIY